MPPLRKRLKRYLRYLLVRSALFAVGLLPLEVASALGAAFGGLAFAFAGKERKKALASLQRAGLDPGLAKGCFRHLGAAAFELGCIRQIDARFDEVVAWHQEDRAVLDAALARKKGVVFVSGHYGNWELLARRVAHAGYPCHTIAKETTDPRTTALVERFRGSVNLQSIWRGRDGAARAMLKVLKAGAILGLLIDQDTDVQSLWVDFFGHRAKTPRAAADLALRTQAAVVLGFCTRLGPGRYTLSMREVPLTGHDALSLTAALTQAIEAQIRAHPEQWVWMHQRWKSPEPATASRAAPELLPAAAPPPHAPSR